MKDDDETIAIKKAYMQFYGIPWKATFQIRQESFKFAWNKSREFLRDMSK